jgi:hypothetical protein
MIVFVRGYIGSIGSTRRFYGGKRHGLNWFPLGTPTRKPTTAQLHRIINSMGSLSSQYSLLVATRTAISSNMSIMEKRSTSSSEGEPSGEGRHTSQSLFDESHDQSGLKHRTDAYRKKSNNESVLFTSGTVCTYINVRHFKIRIQRGT